MEEFRKNPHPLLLTPGVQHYAWGDTRWIPDLLGIENPEGLPYAELWMGVHPALPSRASLGGSQVSLAELIQGAREETLGPEISGKFQELPYLLKVLSAARPLSIQVHPNREQAREGFARENEAGIPISGGRRNYRDENHKPELLVAITDFYALRGFRPLDEIAGILEETAELRKLLPDFQPSPRCLRSLYEKFMGLSREEVDAVLSPLVERIRGEHKKRPFPLDDHRYWFLRGDEEFSRDGHRDRGLFSIFLLNLVHLRPGQGLYLPAGVLHAYLEGTGIEVLANSDNVLRGGLTPKHVDVPEVLKTTEFTGERPEIIEPAALPASPDSPEGGVWTYRTPAEEFELHRIELTPSRPHRGGPAAGAEILLVLGLAKGSELTLSSGSHSLELARGGAIFIPHGTRYTLESTGSATLYRAAVPAVSGEAGKAGKSDRNQKETFRGRSPVKIAFGTSGLRGLVEDMTDLEVYINTRGFLNYLLSAGDIRRGEMVCLAGDLRPSTDSPTRSILRAVGRAVRDAGLEVDHLGRIPTPALLHHALELNRASIMVTGSHIPFDRNGIKFNRSRGEVLKSDEAGILAAVAGVRREEYGRRAADSLFADDAMFKPSCRQDLPPANGGAGRAFVRRYLDFFPPGGLRGMRIVVYEHSAVGRDLLVEILGSLGGEVIPLGRSEDFVAIDTEAITRERLQLLQEMADGARRQHGPLDAIVSTDGDSDRPMLLGIDRKGKVRFFGGDLLGIVVAEYLEADAIAVPVSATDAIDIHFEARGIHPVRTRIGSPHVIVALQEARGRRVVGWEANGGFLTGSDLERDGRLLKALPTRDALLPILAALHSAAGRKISLVELFNRLPGRFSRSGLIDAFPPAASRALIRKFSPRSETIHQADFEGGGVTLTDSEGNRRGSPAEEASGLEAIREGLRRHFNPARGFGEILRINFIDGVRIHFTGGDIAHIRPSGNAPQLRIYAVADREERAEEIVGLALREPGGILREMESEVGTPP